MSLAAGTRLGSFEVLGPLGAGGMGEVYRASDTRLGREVAIKILPEVFAEDEGRLARFEREARLLASINHPGLAAIYGIEQAGPLRYIVMELVPGETLAEQLARGPLAIPDALRLARQIAEALEAAHEKGIIHRDLKPANIKVTPEGKVKVLDLGLAKAMDSKIETGDTSQSPTMMLDQTRPGVILGTAEFMSPEQARGKAVDKRTDIWAFGCVLYEMLTGWRIFQGETISDVLAAILTAEPDWSRLPKQTPPRVRDLLVRCLKKDANERLRDIGDARLELGSSLDEAPATSGARERAAPTPINRRWAGPVSILVIATAIAAWAYLQRSRSGTTSNATRTTADSTRSLIVLPSRDLSGAPGGQLVGDGLVETLSARLGEIPGIQVVTPTAAVAASDRLVDPFRAAQSVGADLAVRSSLMRSGGAVRIAYSIWDVGKRSQVASGTVDGTASDMFAIQDRLAESVAGGLKLRRAAHRTPTPTGLDGAGAQEKYLQALGNLQRYDKPAQVDAAASLLEALAKEFPNSALVPAALGRAYLYKYNLTRERTWADKAGHEVSRARGLDPELPEVNSTLGELSVRTGHPKEAITAFERALSVRPNDFDALLGLAKAYDAAGDALSAEKTYRRAIALQPSSWTGYSKLGGFFYNKGQIQKAAEMFRRVTELIPDNARAFSNLGAMYELMGDFDRALDSYRQSLRLEPSSVAYGNVGTLEYFSGRFHEASEAFRKAISLTPGDYQLWAELGDALRWIKGSEIESRTAYSKAIALGSEQLSINPRDAAVHSKLAVTFAKAGDAGRAAQHRQIAIDGDPKNGEFLYDAALVSCVAGNRKEAIEWLRRARDSGVSTAHIEREPEFRSLRGEKSFQELFKPDPHKTS